jgi:hypothetical protein
VQADYELLEQEAQQRLEEIERLRQLEPIDRAGVLVGSGAEPCGRRDPRRTYTERSSAIPRKKSA